MTSTIKKKLNFVNYNTESQDGIKTTNGSLETQTKNATKICLYSQGNWTWMKNLNTHETERDKGIVNKDSKFIYVYIMYILLPSCFNYSKKIS